MRKPSVPRRVRAWTGAATITAMAIVVAACGPPPPPPPPPTGSTDTVTVAGQTVVVSVEDGLTVDVEPVSGAPGAPDGLAFPAGAFAVVVEGVEPGAVVPVTMALSSPVDVVRKLIDGVWDVFRFDGLTGSTLSADGRTVSLWLRDGGRGDLDGSADGRIEDPIAPAVATSLTITTNEVPLVSDGEPYSVQLEAAGAAGPVTWSLVGGTLRDGLSLSSDGLLSGTTQPSLSSPFIQVQADDGASATTKLLPQVSIGTPVPVTTTGAPLPDGTRIFAAGISVNAGFGGGRGLGFLEADGTYTPMPAISMTTLSVLGISLVSPDGRWAVDPFGGGLRDAETGVPVVTADPFTADAFARFSPDGTKLAVPSSAGYQVFDTTTWSVVRTAPLAPGSGGGVVWSGDSTEFAPSSVLFEQGGVTIGIRSATDAQMDRSFTIAGRSCNQVTGWSTTGRLLLGCGSDVVSASAADGGDLRVVGSSTCALGFPCRSTVTLGGGTPFSPSGSHLTLLEIETAGNGANVGRTVIVPDIDGAPPVPLSEWSPTPPAPISWR